MAFTYDLATNIGQVRLEIGDTTDGNGVKPDGTNLSDEELQVLLDREGSVGLAAAAACDLLARHWARFANVTTGPRSEQLAAVADQWSKQAENLRDLNGSVPGASSSSFTRNDGFSVHAAGGDDYAR